ncbi:hypothetical protein AMTR_s00056p00141280 [Amborella trichopoda]|uniref:NB-ARC domain-containing protein n=1 Tax=Amborella trichopoda TaxID=13333 RepID=U5CYC6_AMBTC|nr:hypothetical protein AMTR_s00056p00141280 [Amborella trichopoda]
MDFRSPVVVTPPLEAVEELEATPIDDQPTVRSMTQKCLVIQIWQAYIGRLEIGCALICLGWRSSARDELLTILRNNRFLLILDDVWERLELKEIGIPRPTVKNNYCFELEEPPPEIGELQGLQLLDLQGCINMKELPLRLGHLINPRHLDISYIEYLQNIPPKVLSGLRSLEELNAWLTEDDWDADADDTADWSEACLAELNYLSCLTTLDISLHCSHIFPHTMKLLGKRTRMLNFESCTIIDRRAALAPLIEAHSLRSMSFFKSRGLTWLRPLNISEQLYIDQCDDLGCLVHSEDAKDIDAFKTLVMLNLALLPSFERICEGSPPYGCFGLLKEIEVYQCPRLVVLFTSGTTAQKSHSNLCYVL